MRSITERGRPIFYQRLSGFEMRDLPKDFNILNSFMGGSKDRADFADYYQIARGLCRPLNASASVSRSMSDRSDTRDTS